MIKLTLKLHKNQENLMLILNSKKLPKNITIQEKYKSFLQQISRSLQNDYVYYVTGKLHIDKATHVLNKLSIAYDLNLTAKQRFEKYSKGFATSVIHVFQYQMEFHFILMTRDHQKTSLQSPFFKMENYKDARKTRERIMVRDKYEFIRVNKESYDYEEKNIKVSAKNGVWTIRIAEFEKERVWKKFNEALKSLSYFELSQVVYSMKSWIGFAEVRKDYLNFKAKLEQRFYKFTESRGKAITLKEYMNKQRVKNHEEELEILPDSLPYTRY